MKKNLLFKISAVTLAIFSALTTLAQDTTQANPTSEALGITHDIILLAIALVLLCPIYFLIKSFYHAAEQRVNHKSKTLTVLAILSILGTQSAEASAFSQFTATSWMLLALICVEVLAIIILLTNALNIDTTTSLQVDGQIVQGKSLLTTIWEKMNKFRPIEEESEIELDHVYDGIKELDNVTPPWFTIGFVGSIIIAIVYFWLYQISGIMPNQIQEYDKAMAQAAAEHEAYLKSGKGQVDENTVTLLTDAKSIESGKKIFDANCVACHKADGGGQVGPNLTDAYWLHGGSVKDVFTTIKYGVVEKGMIPWKDDLSGTQIAEVVAYIHTLQGTNPPGAKEPQGEFYDESVATANVNTEQ